MHCTPALLFLLSASCLLLPTGAAAQSSDRSAQSGDIVLEDTATRKRNPYQAGQDGAIEFMNGLSTAAVELSAGRAAAPASPSDGALDHLASVYLFCTIRAGTCPWILDAVLEADIMSAKTSNTAGCPTMERFWKAWMRNDMEKRQKFLVRTSNLTVTSEFTQHERPRYIKCRDTVAETLRDSPAVRDFFSKRYAASDGPQTKIARTTKLLTDLKAKVPNIYQALEAER